MMDLTLEDLMEYMEYRDVGLVIIKIFPSTVVLSPVEWYRKYKSDKISGKSSNDMD